LCSLFKGASLFGYLSDKFGRRLVIILALVPCLATMVISSVTTTLLWFTVWRFIVNVFNGGCMVILAVFTTEVLFFFSIKNMIKSEILFDLIKHSI
jgi:MFS family permease